MVWSLFGDRNELWSVGAPLALGGQAMVLIGLILQLEIVSRASFATRESLHEIDEQLSALRQSAEWFPADFQGQIDAGPRSSYGETRYAVARKVGSSRE